MECINSEAALSFILRVILGILFFFQGYDKVFKIKMKGVVDSFRYELGAIKLPGWLLVSSAWFTSYAELIGGTLLILGLFKLPALYLIGFDLILVTGAFSMIKPMWSMGLVFPRLVILSALLYLPQNWDVLSLDYLLFYK